MTILKKEPVTLCLLLHGDNTLPADSINAFNIWVRKELSLYSVSRGYDSDGKGFPRFHLAMVLPDPLEPGYLVRSWELFSAEKGLKVGQGWEQYIDYKRLWIDGIGAVPGDSIPDDVSGGRF